MMMSGKILQNKFVLFFKILFIAILINSYFINQSANSYSSDPKQFITEVVDEAIKTLGDKNLNQETKNNVIEKIALEAVDIRALGLYSLGEIRTTLSPEQLEKYQSLFERYFIKSLNSRLTDYSKQTINIFGSETLNENYTMVNSRIEANDKNPEIKVDWRVYTKNIDKPLIRDLVVEGLSLARTQKEEFNSILAANENKIEFLFEKLSAFINN
jgi:phospholipid transport system substrate-binding protein